MAAVDRFEVDRGVRCDSPTWKEVKAAITALEKAHAPATFSLTIAEDEACAVVSFDPKLGFFLVARQEGETANYQLVQLELGESIVSGIIADFDQSYPRFVFVDRVVALAALREFHAHGRRARDLSWMDELEVVTRYPPK